MSESARAPGRVLQAAIPIESDADRGILRDAIASARAAELLKSQYVSRRGAREGGRRVPASELELPEPSRRRLALLDRLARALDDAPELEAPAAGEPGPATPRQVIEAYLDRVWGQRDLAALDELVDPDYRRHISALLEPLTIEGQRARLGAMQDAFPDISMQLDQVAAEGDLVAFQSVMRGTHRGQFRGLPPTGRPFTVHLVDLVRVRNGRLLEHWGGPDMLDLLTQLGATVEPGPGDR